jgi:hypothetical protein
MDMDKLQSILQEVNKEISLYDLTKKMNIGVDDLLIAINEEIIPEYAKTFKKNAFKIPFFSEDETIHFFQSQIIDLGMLCQHKITEIKEGMKMKHSGFAHQIFYNNWLLYRGY